MAIRGTINVSPSPTPAFSPAPFLDPINQGIQNIAKLRMRDMERKIMEQSQIAREQRAEQRAVAASNRSHANQKDLIDFQRRRRQEDLFNQDKLALAEIIEQNPDLINEIGLGDPELFDINSFTLDQASQLGALKGRLDDTLQNRSKYRSLLGNLETEGGDVSQFGNFIPSWAYTPEGIENMQGIPSPQSQMAELQAALDESTLQNTRRNTLHDKTLSQLDPVTAETVLMNPESATAALERQNEEDLLRRQVAEYIARSGLEPIGREQLEGLSGDQLKILLQGTDDYDGTYESFETDFTRDGSLLPAASPGYVFNDLERATRGNFPGYRRMADYSELFGLQNRAMDLSRYAENLRKNEELLRARLEKMTEADRDQFANAYESRMAELNVPLGGEGDLDLQALYNDRGEIDPVFQAMVDGEGKFDQNVYDTFQSPQAERVLKAAEDRKKKREEQQRQLLQIISSPSFRRLSPFNQKLIRDRVYGQSPSRGRNL